MNAACRITMHFKGGFVFRRTRPLIHSEPASNVQLTDVAVISSAAIHRVHFLLGEMISFYCQTTALIADKLILTKSALN